MLSIKKKCIWNIPHFTYVLLLRFATQDVKMAKRIRCQTNNVPLTSFMFLVNFSRFFFSCLYSWSYYFGLYSILMTIGEGWNVDWLVNREFRLSAQLLLHLDGPGPRYCWCCTKPPVNLTLHFPPHLWTRTRDTLTPLLEVATHSQPGESTEPQRPAPTENVCDFVPSTWT